VRKPEKIPVALTIAGSDSGGGAGIQADLKTFAALGVHGASVITAVTAQNPRRVLGVQPCQPEIVRKQLEAVFSEMKPAAVKTGMLYSAEIVSAVANFFSRRQLIVDPVLVSSSGAPLLKPSAVRLLQSRLLPLARLVTPNLFEAEILTGRKLTSIEDLRFAAKEIHRRFGCAALVKGGHMRGGQEAADVFFDGRTELLLTARRVKGVKTHGTGCTYSAAIASFLARGKSLPDAVTLAKAHITEAIVRHQLAGGHAVLNNFW